MDPNKIFLRNIPSGVNDEQIRKLFKLNNDHEDNIGLIKNIVRIKENQTGYYVICVEFLNSNDALNILKSGSIAYGNNNFKVEPFDEKELVHLDKVNEKTLEHDRAVVIENVDSDQVEGLVLFYEKEPETGGSTICKHSYDETTRELALFYDSSTTAQRVIERGATKYGTKFYTAKKYFDRIASSIVVESVDEDMIEGVLLVFENKKCGGGFIMSHTYEQPTSSLIITYENPDVAQRVLKFGEIRFRNRVYVAKPYKPKKSMAAAAVDAATPVFESDEFINAILIENISTDELDDVLLLFESQKTGGGHIERHEYFDKLRCLVFFYKEPRNALNVLTRGGAKYMGKTYIPKKVTKELFEVLKKKAITSQIIVDNVSDDEVEMVLMLFENPRKSGGGPIKNHSYMNDMKQLVIDYTNPQSADSAIKYGVIEFKGKQYRALKHGRKQTTTANKRATMSNNDLSGSRSPTASLTSSMASMVIDVYDPFKLKLVIFETVRIESESIQLYLNILLDGIEYAHCKIDYGLNEMISFNNCTEYLVICKKQFNYERVLAQHKRMPKLMDNVVEVERVKETKSVLVQSGEHPDIVQLYFQSEKESGGGDIRIFKKIEGLMADSYIFLIEFEDKRCVNRVFSRNHRPGMKVQPFYDDVNIFEAKIALKFKEQASMKVKKKEETLTLDLSTSKFPFSFIIKTKKYFEKLQELVGNENLSATNDKLQIKYFKSNENVLQSIKEFEKQFALYEWTIDADLLLKLKPKLSGFYAESSNLVLSFIDDNDKQVKIRIEGDAETIKAEINKISCIINDDNNKKIEDKVSNLREYQCTLLLKDEFIKVSKQARADIAIKIAPPSGTITFNGFFESVLWTKQRMWDIVNSIRHKETLVPFTIGKFLKDCREYVEQLFENNHILCEYEMSVVNENLIASETDLINNGTCKISLYAIHDSELPKASQFINQNFIQFKFELQDESLELLEQLYPQFLQRLRDELKSSQEEDHVIFLASKANRKVWCVGERLLVGSLSQRIKDFFEANTELSIYSDFDGEDLRYLDTVKSKEIQNICMTLQRQNKCLAHVAIEKLQNDIDTEIRLRMTGNKRIIELMKRQIQILISKKMVGYFEIKDSSIFDLFTSHHGKRNLAAIENQCQCLIINTKDTNEDDSTGVAAATAMSVSPVKSSMGRSGSRIEGCVYTVSAFGVNIRVVNSTLDMFEHSEVVTISTHSDLKPFDDVSRSVLEKAGDAIMPEIRSLLQDNNIFEGEAYAIKTDKLRFCKSIVNAIVPKKIEDKKELPFLMGCIKESLLKTNEFQSIAFSLFYGQRLIKPDVTRNVIESLFTSIFNYLLDFPNSSFKEIYIVDDKNTDLIVEILKRFSEQYQLEELADSLHVDEDTPANNSRITIEIGTILDSKHQLNAIVNTTSVDLNLNNGTVSKLILKKAGETIQQELNENYPNGLSNKCIVAVSSAGNLTKVDHVFHIALESYEKVSEGKTKEAFQRTITRLLEVANKNNCKSIGMPAVGTGALNYPRDKVAKWMFDAINAYFAKTKKTSVERVVIVLFDKDVDTIKEFKAEEQRNNSRTGVDVEEDIATARSKKTNSNATSSNENFFTNLTIENKTVKMKFKNVFVEVLVGDICTSKEHVIINPTDSSFRLGGNVSKALLKAAGNALQDELGPAPRLNKNGVYWTSAGNLSAKKILHIDVSSAEIKECIVNSLAFVDEDGYPSVVYPVIGTGALHKDSKGAVKDILEAFALYIHSVSKTRSLNVKYIKVCIYEAQENLLQVFTDEMNELLRRRVFKSAPWYAKMYDKAKHMFEYVTKAESSSQKAEATAFDRPSEMLRFKLVSDDEKNIERAKAQLNDIMSQDKITQMLSHEHIRMLDAKQSAILTSICQSNYVISAVDKDLGRIKLAGRTANVAKCISELNKALNDYMKSTIEEAQEIARGIQWEYCATKNKWKPYNIYLNAQIEEAYQQKEKEFEFNDENDEQCCIDFALGTQNRKGTRQKMYDIRRVDLKNRLELKIPDYWDNTKTSDLVPLDSKSAEWKTVINQLNGNKFGNRTVLSIERVQNQRLYVQYQAHKKYFEERDKANVNERTLFHGTTSDTVVNIWKFGFNRSYAGKNATFFGKGVYFARDASYSQNYTDIGSVTAQNAPQQFQNKTQGHLFVCKVLLGYYVVGNKDIETKNLPKAPDGVTPVDSTVDQVQNPTIFVLFHDAQAYPEYLVTYK